MIVAFSVGQSSSTSTQPISTVSSNSPQSQVTPKQTAGNATQPVSNQSSNISNTENINTVSSDADESATCAQQSEQWYNSQYNSVTQNGLYPQNEQGLLTYTNHFNATQGKCFMLETYYGNAGTASAGSDLGLYDVYDHNVIANYSVIPNSPNPICIINGASCTKAEFDALLDYDMDTTAY